jgi:hypothetical protein
VSSWTDPQTIAITVSAVATAVMAVATARLASRTAAMAKAANEETAAALEQGRAVQQQAQAALRQAVLAERQVRLSSEQLELSRQSIQGSIKPFITMGEPKVAGESAAPDASNRAGYAGGSGEALPLVVLAEGAFLRASLTIRNAGLGLAIIDTDESFVVGWSSAKNPEQVLMQFTRALLPNPILLPNERAFVEFEVDLRAWSIGFSEITHQANTDGEIYFDIVYGDIRKQQRVRARFHGARIKANDTWRVFETLYFEPEDDDKPSLVVLATDVAPPEMDRRSPVPGIGF